MKKKKSEICEIWEDGNTKLPNQLIKWFFTFNNYSNDDIEILETKFKTLCTKYIFQEECGINGTVHLQGSIWLKKRMRFSEFGLNPKIHWEALRNEKASIEYCKKDDTRNGRIFSFGFPKPIKIITNLKPYQLSLENLILTEPDDRNVYWVYNKEGNIGKSSLCKYLHIKHNCLVIQGGKLNDIINVIFNSNMDLVNTVLIDIPRNNGNIISFSAIEMIKNGMIFNTKYETGIKVFNSPHVIIFSNSLPDITKFSLDRWKIYDIVNDELIELNKNEIKNINTIVFNELD